MHTYEQFLNNIDEFIELKESMDFSKVMLLEKVNTGKRLIDHIPNINESEHGFSELNEEEKYELDNLLWEGILVYSVHGEEIFEGFWGNVVKGVRDMGKKALMYTKSILTNIGKLIKDIAGYVKAFLKKGLELANKGTQAVWGKIKGKAEEKTARMDKHPEIQVKKEVEQLKETTAYIAGEIIFGDLETGAKDALAAASDAADKDSEAGENLEDRIEDEIQGEKQKEMDKRRPSSNEGWDVVGIIHAINEIRKDENFDFAAFINDSEIYQEACLEFEEYNQILEKYGSDADVGDPKSDAEQKKSSILSRLKGAFSIKNIVQFIVSGVVTFFEKGLELLFNVGFNAFSNLVSKGGGPGPYTWPAISAMIAVCLGLVLEYGLEMIAEFTGLEALKVVAEGLHAVNPVYWLQKGVELLVPGASVVLKTVSVCVVLYIALSHLWHKLVHGDEEHGEEGHGEEKKEKNEGFIMDYQKFINEIKIATS